jgi:hypothetical protein
MKIYSVTLHLYSDDNTPSPDKWDWDNLISMWKIKGLSCEIVGCERRVDIESTIPTKDYSTIPDDLMPCEVCGNSDHPTRECE